MASEPPMFRWHPGMVCEAAKEPVMPCGLTFSELPDLTSEDMEQDRLALEQQQALAEQPPPPRVRASLEGRQAPGTHLDHTPTTPVLADSRTSSEHLHKAGSRAACSVTNSAAAFISGVASCSAAHLNHLKSQVVAASGGSSEAGGSSIRSSNSAEVFAAVNRVALVAGSEYVKQRSGGTKERRRSQDRRRSGEWRRTKSGRQTLTSDAKDLLQPSYLSQLHQAATTVAKMLPASPLAPGAKPCASKAGKAEAQGTSVAAWLANSAAGPSSGPDEAGQRPPSPQRQKQTAAATCLLSSPSMTAPPPPPAAEAAGVQPTKELLKEAALQLSFTPHNASILAPPAHCDMHNNSTRVTLGSAACPSTRLDGGERRIAAPAGSKVKEPCWHNFNPVAALTRLLRF